MLSNQGSTRDILIIKQREDRQFSLTKEGRFFAQIYLRTTEVDCSRD